MSMISFSCIFTIQRLLYFLVVFLLCSFSSAVQKLPIKYGGMHVTTTDYFDVNQGIQMAFEELNEKNDSKNVEYTFVLHEDNTDRPPQVIAYDIGTKLLYEDNVTYILCPNRNSAAIINKMANKTKTPVVNIVMFPNSISRQYKHSVLLHLDQESSTLHLLRYALRSQGCTKPGILAQDEMSSVTDRITTILGAFTLNGRKKPDIQFFELTSKKSLEEVMEFIYSSEKNRTCFFIFLYNAETLKVLEAFHKDRRYEPDKYFFFGLTSAYNDHTFTRENSIYFKGITFLNYSPSINSKEDRLSHRFRTQLKKFIKKHNKEIVINNKTYAVVHKSSVDMLEGYVAAMYAAGITRALTNWASELKEIPENKVFVNAIYIVDIQLEDIVYPCGIDSELNRIYNADRFCNVIGKVIFASFVDRKGNLENVDNDLISDAGVAESEFSCSLRINTEYLFPYHFLFIFPKRENGFSETVKLFMLGTTKATTFKKEGVFVCADLLSIAVENVSTDIIVDKYEQFIKAFNPMMIGINSIGTIGTILAMNHKIPVLYPFGILLKTYEMELMSRADGWKDNVFNFDPVLVDFIFCVIKFSVDLQEDGEMIKVYVDDKKLIKTVKELFETFEKPVPPIENINVKSNVSMIKELNRNYRIIIILSKEDYITAMVKTVLETDRGQVFFAVGRIQLVYYYLRAIGYLHLQPNDFQSRFNNYRNIKEFLMLEQAQNYDFDAVMNAAVPYKGGNLVRKCFDRILSALNLKGSGKVQVDAGFDVSRGGYGSFPKSSGKGGRLPGAKKIDMRVWKELLNSSINLTNSKEAALSRMYFAAPFPEWWNSDSLIFERLRIFANSTQIADPALPRGYIAGMIVSNIAKVSKDALSAASAVFTQRTFSFMGLNFGPFSNVTCSSSIIKSQDPDRACQCTKGPRRVFLNNFANWVFNQSVITKLQVSEYIASCGVKLIPLPASQKKKTISIVVIIAALLLIIAIAIPLLLRHFNPNKNAPKNEDVAFAMAFTDIQSSTALWSRVPEVMGAAVQKHHELIRKIIKAYKGYEVKTIGDSFMVAFKSCENAVKFAVGIQSVFFYADWPKCIDETYVNMFVELADTEEDVDKRRLYEEIANMPGERYVTLWHGVRVRVGVHHGFGSVQKDPVSKRYDYYGTVVNTTARVEGVGHGGQVLVTEAALDHILSNNNKSNLESVIDDIVCTDIGAQPLRGLDEPVVLYQILPLFLQDRFFPPLRLDVEKAVEDNSLDDNMTEDATCGVQSIEDRINNIMTNPSNANQIRTLRINGNDLLETYSIVMSFLTPYDDMKREKIIKEICKSWQVKCTKQQAPPEAVNSKPGSKRGKSQRGVSISVSQSKKSVMTNFNGGKFDPYMKTIVELCFKVTGAAKNQTGGLIGRNATAAFTKQSTAELSVE